MIPGKLDLGGLSSSEKLVKAQELSERLETMRSEFDKGFEEGFQYDSSLGIISPDMLDFLADSVAIIFYLAGLIGVSVLLGWLISFAF